MNDNPYAPPSARVADAEAAGSLERPPIVTRAVYLIWTSFVLIIPSTIYDVLDPEPGSTRGENLAIFAFILAASGAYYYWLNGAAWRGKGYARWVLAVMTAIGYSLIFWVWREDLASEFLQYPWYLQVSEILAYVAESTGIILLFTPGANAWYREMRARR
jgi:hypothetical protein